MVSAMVLLLHTGDYGAGDWASFEVQKLLLLHDSYLRVPKRGVLLVA